MGCSKKAMYKWTFKTVQNCNLYVSIIMNRKVEESYFYVIFSLFK